MLRRRLSSSVFITSAIVCLVGLFFFLGKGDNKTHTSDGSASASDGESPASNHASTAVGHPVLPSEQGRPRNIVEIRQNYLDALEQAKQNNLVAIEQSNENYSRAIEEYQREYWASVDRYRSMTPAEKAQIHSKSLQQIGLDHEMELREARQAYSEAVERAKQEYDEEIRSISNVPVALAQTVPNQSAVSINSMGVYAEFISTLKDVDFKNRPYKLGGTEVQVKDGSYKHRT